MTAPGTSTSTPNPSGYGGSGVSSSSAVGANQVASPFPGLPASVGQVVMARNATNATVGTHRTPCIAPYALTDIRAVFINSFTSSDTTNGQDTDNTADLNLNIGLEYPLGTIYRVTTKGLTTAIVSPGAAVVTDPISIEIPAGATYFWRVFTSGASWHSNRVAYVAGGGGFTVTTDLTAPGSGAIADATSFTLLMGPQLVLATPSQVTKQPSVFAVGDSIAFGTGDGMSTWNNAPNTNNTNVQGPGWIGRAALNVGVGYISACLPGDTGANFNLPASHFRRMVAARNALTGYYAYGRNDITNGASLATMQATAILGWQLLNNRGLRVIQPTITPRTSSTDGWLTTANQTPTPSAGAETIRVNFNTWLRQGAPILAGVATTFGTSGAVYAGSTSHPLYAVEDVATSVESSLNSGLWVPPVNQRTVTDGVATSGNFVCTSATAAFVAGDAGRTIIIQGAGVAGAPYVSVIASVSNATTVQLQPTSIGTTVNPATMTICDGYCLDGLHPLRFGHIAIAAAVNTSRWL